MKYDVEKIKSIINKNYKGKYSKEDLENIFEKIPEIFSILLKERQKI
jgi:hypothetical protein